jgi:hypothetical protein
MKKRKMKNLNNLEGDKTCHQCLKSNPKSEYFLCQKKDCKNYYCYKCLRKYPKAPFVDCFACKKICKCVKCKGLHLKKSSNHVEIDLNQLEKNTNLIKIDDFVILENEGAENESQIDSEGNSASKQIKEESYVKDNEFEERGRRYLKRVEYNSTLLENKKECLVCVKVKDEFLVFKSLEEFVHYVKYFFNEMLADGYDMKDIKEVKDIKEEDYTKSKKEFSDYLVNYQKYYQNSEYIFKSIRCICKECFIVHLKDQKGFYNLFNQLQIGSQLILNNNNNVNGNNGRLNKKDKKLNSNHSKHRHSNHSNENSKIKNNKICNEVNNNINISPIEKNNVTPDTIGSNSLPQINPFIPSSINKLFPNLNPNKISDNSNSVKNESAVNEFFDTRPESNQNNLDKRDQFNLNLSSLLNNPEALNVTNIIMNFDQNKGNNMNSFINNALEELRKQFFSIQYYSLLQKLFISYVFKNLEMFIENLSHNQKSSDFILNNVINYLPKNQIDNSESSAILREITDHLSLLKNVNNNALVLTSALGINIEDFKNQEKKLFSMNEHKQGTMNSAENEVLNIIEILRNNMNQLSNQTHGNAQGFNPNQNRGGLLDEMMDNIRNLDAANTMSNGQKIPKQNMPNSAVNNNTNNNTNVNNNNISFPNIPSHMANNLFKNVPYSNQNPQSMNINQSSNLNTNNNNLLNSLNLLNNLGLNNIHNTLLKNSNSMPPSNNQQNLQQLLLNEMLNSKMQNFNSLPNHLLNMPLYPMQRMGNPLDLPNLNILNLNMGMPYSQFPNSNQFNPQDLNSLFANPFNNANITQQSKMNEGGIQNSKTNLFGNIHIGVK